MPGSYNRAVAITKSDTVNFDGSTYSASAATKAIPCEAIFCGTAGTVAVVFEDGSVAGFTMASGITTPLRAIRVNSTGTAGALLVALYTV
jgi:hypothetical protein